MLRLFVQTEFKKLNRLISALLCTQSESALETNYAKALALKQPYDQHKLKLFEELVIYIKRCNFIERGYSYSETTFRNISFFESYFSNYIEGTEFTIDEAEDIVFTGSEINSRHADSHDVLALFTLTFDHSEMCITPESPSELLNLLQIRHAYLMKERPDKQPGQFKLKPNHAGNTYFVEPNDVNGTLYHGFEIYQSLNDGMEKALFIHFLISEVHPFKDGNGRLSRIMMNAELVKANLYKIIIPTVHRENYLNGLRKASRDHDFRIYCKAIDQAQAYSARLDWIDYSHVRCQIESDKAHSTADEGLPIFNRKLRQLLLSDFA